MNPTTLNPSQRAVVDCRSPVCVLAGAGSGKTLTLVEAITSRLEEGWAQDADISQVLALTFTDKAAAELRQRLASAFAGRRRRAEAEGRAALVDFWRAQAARLDRADIGTIHSYAFKLVRENAFQLGLPAAPILDPDETRLGRDLGELFLDWLDQGRPELLRLLKYYPPATLKELLAACAARLGSWGLSRLSAPSPVAAGEVEGRLAAFGRLAGVTLERVLDGAIAPDKKYYAPVRAALEGLGAAASSPAGLEEKIRKIRALLTSSGRWYTAQGLKTGLSEALEALEAAAGQHLVQPILDDLLALVNILPEALARARARRGTINYDDILSLARRLLAACPEVRRLEAGRLRLVLIDEFQDTNRLQANLLAYLLLPPEDQNRYPEEDDLWGGLDWAAASPIFSAYGDLKQSIYRFRGAEVEVMAGLKKNLAGGGGQVLALDLNYRSQTPLVEFFNALFPGRLEPYFTGLDLQLGVRPPLYEGPHIVRLHAAGSSARLVGDRAAEEARLLAAYLTLLFQGRSGVLVDGGAEGPRPPRPGDVAVLFRRFKFAQVFRETFLAAGWPVRLARDDSPLDYAEGRGLLAAFSYLCGLDPELNLAAALRSPLGPVTDQALLSLVRPPDEPPARVSLTDYFSGARPWPADLPPDDREVLTEVRDLFSELAPLVGRLKPVEILERLVEERRLLPLAALEPDGEARAQALTGFLALSRALGRGFQNPAEELAELGRSRCGRPGAGSQALTLSTVHTAKGLEFPIVVIAESDYHFRARAPRLLTSGDGRLALNWRPSGWSTPPASFLELSEEEDRLEIMENNRLFYVAATRARDHLVFLGRPKSQEEGKKKAHTWFQALLDCPEAVALSGEMIQDPAEFPEQAAPEAVRARPSGQAAIPGLLEPMTLNCVSLSVTELAHHLAGFWEPPADLSRPAAESPAVPDPAGPLTPLEAGLLFHAVMEIIDLREPYPRELLVAEAARLGLAPEAPGHLVGPIEAFLDSPWGRDWLEATRAGRAVFREWPFQLRLRERGGQGRHLKVGGVIDLFFQSPGGGGRIVDYKFTAFPGRDGAGQLRVYENQVRLYALALQSAGLAEDLEASLYFAGGARPHFHQVDLKAGWNLEFWEDFFKNFFNEVKNSRLRL
ncbi:MAG: UvrD-helicase domain-containing protein [Candidatus Adiutrix sp.]|jgi:ATP-dependent exoDNAse (exonuclease V) beta subunit|nr:UvrD-helicase domain-containing protein [Candidatus Adiutrix sp.]